MILKISFTWKKRKLNSRNSERREWSFSCICQNCPVKHFDYSTVTFQMQNEWKSILTEVHKQSHSQTSSCKHRSDNTNLLCIKYCWWIKKAPAWSLTIYTAITTTQRLEINSTHRKLRGVVRLKLCISGYYSTVQWFEMFEGNSLIQNVKLKCLKAMKKIHLKNK